MNFPLDLGGGGGILRGTMSDKNLPAFVRRLKKALDDRYGEFTSAEMSYILATTPKYIREWSGHPVLQPYKKRGPSYTTIWVGKGKPPVVNTNTSEE